MNFLKNMLPYLLYSLLFFYVMKNWILYKEPVKKEIPKDFSGQVYNYPKTELESSIPNTTINFPAEHECAAEEFYTLSTPECDFILSTFGGCLARIEYKGAMTMNGKPQNVNYGERFVRARQGASPIGTLALLCDSAESPVNYGKVTQTTTQDGKPAIMMVGQGNGMMVEKTFWAGEKPYEINMSFKVLDHKNALLDKAVRIILCPLSIAESNDTPMAIFYDSINGNFNKQVINTDNNTAVKTPNFFGWETKYFVSMLQCNNEVGEPNLSASRGFFTNAANGLVAMVEIKNCAPENNSVKLYAGPRNIGTLAAYGVGAEKTIDLGWWDMICRFLLKILEMINNLLGNLGLSVIFLAIILKLIMFPLILFCKSKSAVVTRFEKANAGQIAMIEKTYAKDAIKKTEELSKFYNAHGVSMTQKSIEIIPGILSLFLFIPAYSFAKYEIFYKAPFFFWIKDLSVADPYMIIPSVLGLFILSRIFTDDMIKQFGILSFFFPVLFMYMFSSAPAVMALWLMTSFGLDLMEKAVTSAILKI